MDSLHLELLVETPMALWLLLALPVVVALGVLSRYELKGWRKLASIGLRTGMAFLLILSLAGFFARPLENKTAVVYVLDVSDSVTKGQLEEGLNFIEEAQKKGSSKDVAAVVRFAATPYLETPFASQDEFKVDRKRLVESRKYMDLKQTDIQSALTFAAALYPTGYDKRLVLLTDGRETQGTVLAEAKFIQAENIDLVVKGLPLPTSDKLDVQVTKVLLSQNQARLGEGVEGQVVIQSNQEVEGTLILRKNGIIMTGGRRKIKLEKGLNDGRKFSFKDNLYDKGLNLYEVEFEPKEGKKDNSPKNNKAQGLVFAYSDELRVLVVETEEEKATHLMSALAQEKIRSRWIPPSGLGPIIYDYDAVVLSDVPVSQLENENFTSDEIMTLIEDYVRKGGGFIMIGGQNSFGLGGYIDTRLEKILPVEMDIPKKVELPSVAIALVIDRSGSMASQNKITLAKEAAVKVVELLKPKDWIGVVTFDSRHRWEVMPVRVINKDEINEKIRRIGATGGTYIYPALKEAYLKLRDLHQAKIKHIILLTDGRTQHADHDTLCRQIRDADITLSCVAVGQGADRNLLKRMAKLGGGRSYYTRNVKNIPRIFTQEAIKVSKSTIVDEPFKPAKAPIQFLEGIDFDTAPELLGYVVTRPKKTAIISLNVPATEDGTESRPLLATWKLGLGRTAAFTSDAKNRWANLWIDGWPGFPKFWAQVMRYIAKKKVQGNYELDVQEDGRKVEFVLKSADENSQFMNRTDFKLKLYRFADGKKEDKPHKVLSMKQIAPGMYKTNFKSDDLGYYVAVLHNDKDTKELQSAGFSITDQAEYIATGLDEELLAKVAAQSRLVYDGDPLSITPTSDVVYDSKIVTEAPPVPAGRPIPLWPYLLMTALFLLPVDIAVRRITWTSAKVAAIPSLPMRPLEAFIRTAAAVVGFVGGAVGGYYLGANYLSSPVWFLVAGIDISLVGVAIGAVAAAVLAGLMWKFIIRGRML